MAQIVNRGKNKWLVRVFLGEDRDGKRKFLNKTIHGTKRDAEAWAAEQERRRDLMGPEAVKVLDLTVGGLIEAFLERLEVLGRKSAAIERMRACRHLLPELGGLPASKLTSDQVQAYIRKKQDAGLSNASINRCLSILRGALNLAMESEPPKIQRAPRIPELPEGPPRSGFFEEHEYRALFRELPDHLKPVLAFGYWTGCRKGEILNLRWHQLDLDAGVARLRAGETKSGEGRLIPLAPELLEILRMHRERCAGARPDDHVFTYEGRPFRDFRDGWEAACRRAGLWDGERNRPTRTFHDLRRTAVRNLVRAGTPEKVAMEISGHKTRSVFERYNIVTEADLLAAARRLQEHIDSIRRASSHTDSHPEPDGTHTIVTQQAGRVN